jgi:hypothetical protein
MRWPPGWKFVSWNNVLVVGETPGGKNVSTEADDICWDPSRGNDW